MHCKVVVKEKNETKQKEKRKDQNVSKREMKVSRFYPKGDEGDGSRRRDR